MINFRCFFAFLVATFAMPICLFAQESIEPRSSDSITAEPTPIEQNRPKRERASEDDRSSSSSKSDSIAERARRLNMTPEQFTAAGLDKLTPDQLANLERSMKGQQSTGGDRATQRAEAEARRAQAEAQKAQAEAQKAKADAQVKSRTKVSIDQLDTRVDGTLDRLTGHSIIRLEDGSLWKQSNPEDRYPAPVKDHPTARVYRSTFGYKMRISGIPEFYVDPVRK